MSEEKAPAFQFYVKDYTTDEAVMMMSLEQEGAFIRLLAWSWKRGGAITPDPQVMKVSPRRAAAVWSGIRPRWVEVEGGFVNERLEQVRAERVAWIEKSRRGGLASAAARNGGKQ